MGVISSRVRELLLPLAIWLLLCALAAGTLAWAQRSSRDDLVQRFDMRTSLGSQFVATYVQDVLARERVQATGFLAGKTVSAADFRRSAATFGYPAAVLLDAEGRVLRAAPADPALIGRNLLPRYAHLRAAVAGKAAVSAVVPSASRHLAVTAFAVPFETPYGRRVFSGAVEVARSPLSAYLTKALSIPGNRVFLIDSSGQVVASNTAQTGNGSLASEEPQLSERLSQRSGTYSNRGIWTFSSYPVSGTGWRLVATVPNGSLYGPLAGAATGARVGLLSAAAVGLVAVFMAARGARSRRELRLSEQRFRAVFDSSLAGMAVTDVGGRYLQVNSALCEILGRSRENLLESSVAEVTHPDDLAATLAGKRETLAGRIPGFTLEKRYLRPDGQTRHCATTVTLLRHLDRQPHRFALQMVDITERRLLENERAVAQARLAEHADELEHINGDLAAARDRMADFVAMLSHDVRQPITGILGYAETLTDDWENLSEGRKRSYLLSITSAGKRLNQMVEDILTVAQLDAGVLTGRPAVLDLNTALQEAVGTLPPDQALDVVIAAPDGIRVRADPGHLQRILTNLLGNAVKYGSPPYDLSARPAATHVELAICDHGEGVPEAFVSHLFDRFSRADTGVATTKRGTGLGLYIVRTLADAGGIGLSYRPNKPTGACFLVKLPAVVEPVAANTDVRTSAGGRGK
jgi:PAS domain S-box-containing protein